MLYVTIVEICTKQNISVMQHKKINKSVQNYNYIVGFYPLYN